MLDVFSDYQQAFQAAQAEANTYARPMGRQHCYKPSPLVFGVPPALPPSQTRRDCRGGRHALRE